MATLFEKLGGKGAISAVVDRFYDIMMEDERVNHYYSETNMQKLRGSQKEFITMITGGPNNYTGEDMYTAHCKYDITRDAFDITWQHLEESLHYYEVPEDLTK